MARYSSLSSIDFYSFMSFYLEKTKINIFVAFSRLAAVKYDFVLAVDYSVIVMKCHCVRMNIYSCMPSFTFFHEMEHSVDKVLRISFLDI